MTGFSHTPFSAYTLLHPLGIMDMSTPCMHVHMCTYLECALNSMETETLTIVSVRALERGSNLQSPSQEKRYLHAWLAALLASFSCIACIRILKHWNRSALLSFSEKYILERENWKCPSKVSYRVSW